MSELEFTSTELALLYEIDVHPERAKYLLQEAKCTGITNPRDLLIPLVAILERLSHLERQSEERRIEALENG